MWFARASSELRAAAIRSPSRWRDGHDHRVAQDRRRGFRSSAHALGQKLRAKPPKVIEGSCAPKRWAICWAELAAEASMATASSLSGWNRRRCWPRAVLRERLERDVFRGRRLPGLCIGLLDPALGRDLPLILVTSALSVGWAAGERDKVWTVMVLDPEAEEPDPRELAATMKLHRLGAGFTGGQPRVIMFARRCSRLRHWLAFTS